MAERGTEPRAVLKVVSERTGLVHDVSGQPAGPGCGTLRSGRSLQLFSPDGEPLVQIVLCPDLDPLSCLGQVHRLLQLAAQRGTGTESTRSEEHTSELQ